VVGVFFTIGGDLGVFWVVVLKILDFFLKIRCFLGTGGRPWPEFTHDPVRYSGDLCKWWVKKAVICVKEIAHLEAGDEHELNLKTQYE